MLLQHTTLPISQKGRGNCLASGSMDRRSQLSSLVICEYDVYRAVSPLRVARGMVGVRLQPGGVAWLPCRAGDLSCLLGLPLLLGVGLNYPVQHLSSSG